MKKALLIGNYGIGNLGDEALKNFFLTSSLNVDWTVLSANPSSGNEVPRLPTGLRSFLRFNYLKTLKVFISAEVAIFGGGTLFTDTESRWAGFIWWIHACWCYVLGIPYILAFQGFGPFKPGFGTSFAKWSVKRAALVIVRDVQSFKRVKEWKMKGDLLQSVDPVLWQVRTIAQQHELLPTDGHLLIIPRHNSTDSFNDALQDVFTDRDWSKVTVVSMEPNNQQELTVCQQIAMQCPGEVTLSAVSTLEELVEIVADAEHVVSQRLHGAVAAIGLGRSVDIISQRKNDKLDALAQLALKPDVLQQKIDNVEEVMSVLQQLIAL